MSASAKSPALPTLDEPFLPPIDKPRGLILPLLYAMSRRQSARS
ncbi:MAG: hypothetical protein WA476_03035 [Acidobacteriaceae bacterium]